MQTNVVDLLARKQQLQAQALPNLARNRILCISGWKNSGKDTVADYLEKHYGYSKVSFAAALKDLVASLFNVPRSYMDDRAQKEAALLQYPVIATDSFSSKIHDMLRSEFRDDHWTPRALCILIGSIMRSVYSNYWVSRVAESLRRIPTGKYVISDMRYKSEADVIKIMFSREEVLCIRINRYDAIDTQDPSERDLDDYKFDIVMGNRHSVESLHSTVDAIMHNLGIPKQPGGSTVV